MVANEGLGAQIHVDSVGTAQLSSRRLSPSGTRRILAQHGIESTSRARQLNSKDLAQTDYLIVMDRSNQADLESLASRHPVPGHIALLLDYAANTSVIEVPDPYYTGNFEVVYDLVKSGCEGLLAHIRAEHKI